MQHPPLCLMKMMIYLSTSYVLSFVFSFRSRRYDAASVDVSSSPAAAASSSSAVFALSAFSAISRFRAIHAGSGGGGGGGSGAPGVVALANDACTHTKRRRGGVQRRQVELKGVEVGD